MTDLGLDASQETRITVMQLKIERLENTTNERRNEEGLRASWEATAGPTGLKKLRDH